MGPEPSWHNLVLDRDPLTFPKGLAPKVFCMAVSPLGAGLAKRATPALMTGYGKTVFQLLHHERGQIDRTFAGVP